MDDIILTGNKASFSISLIGQNTKQPYIGSFTCKCTLNPLDFIRADSLYRELLGNVHPSMASARAQDMSFALSQLKYRLIESPSFWKNEELNGAHIDDNVLYHVLNTVFEAEKRYLNKSIERAKDMKDQLHNSIVNDEFKKEIEESTEESDLLSTSLNETINQLSDLE